MYPDDQDTKFSTDREANHDPRAFPPELAYYFEENFPENTSVQLEYDASGWKPRYGSLNGRLAGSLTDREA